MKLYTIADIRALKLGYDPTEHLPEGWTGTLIDLLELKQASQYDRILIATKLLNNKTSRLFEIYFMRAQEWFAAASLVPDPVEGYAKDVRDAVWDAQIEKLIEMIREGGGDG